MNLHVGIIAAFFALILVQGCSGNDATPPFQQNVTGDVVTQEEGRKQSPDPQSLDKGSTTQGQDAQGDSC